MTLSKTKIVGITSPMGYVNMRRLTNATKEELMSGIQVSRILSLSSASRNEEVVIFSLPRKHLPDDSFTHGMDQEPVVFRKIMPTVSELCEEQTGTPGARVHRRLVVGSRVGEGKEHAKDGVGSRKAIQQISRVPGAEVASYERSQEGSDQNRSFGNHYNHGLRRVISAPEQIRADCRTSSIYIKNSKEERQEGHGQRPQNVDGQGEYRGTGNATSKILQPGNIRFIGINSRAAKDKTITSGDEGLRSMGFAAHHAAADLKRSWRVQTFDLVMHSDSSMYGWEATLGKELGPGLTAPIQTQELWAPRDQLKHITYKEVKAVRNALESFHVSTCPLETRSLLAWVGNQAAVQIINSRVSRSGLLMAEVRKLQRVLQKLKSLVQLLPSVENHQADRQSREFRKWGDPKIHHELLPKGEKVLARSTAQDFPLQEFESRWGNRSVRMRSSNLHNGIRGGENFARTGSNRGASGTSMERTVADADDQGQGTINRVIHVRLHLPRKGPSHVLLRSVLLAQDLRD